MALSQARVSQVIFSAGHSQGFLFAALGRIDHLPTLQTPQGPRLAMALPQGHALRWAIPGEYALSSRCC